MKFGLEKEALIFDHNFNEYKFDNNFFEENFQIDFCDNQLEIISNVCDTIEELHQEMNNYLNKIPKDSLCWPISNCGLDFNITFNNKYINKEYRLNLLKKYGKAKMITSGIHFNVSGFKSSNYEMLKKIYMYGPLIMQFFAFTPFEEGISIRNTNKNGYFNDHQLKIDYNNEKTYNDSINELIKNKIIQQKSELYSRVRLKDNYIELRFIDLNPFYYLGISYEQLKLLENFIKYLDHLEINSIDIQEGIYNYDYIATFGKNKDIEITINHEKKSLKEHTIELLEKIKQEDEYIGNYFLEKYLNNKTDLDKYLEKLKLYKNSDFFGKENCYKYKFFVADKKYENLELSTQILIQEAMDRKLNVEIYDEKYNVINIENNYVIQATKTNLDKYVDILFMDNKYLTKKKLIDANLNTPKMEIYHDNLNFKEFNKKIVIKPIDTNFGLGVNILNNQEEEIKYALKNARKYSDTLLVEDFAKGLEYRFLVINGECISVLMREACNVCGDGIKSIKELIDLKNENILRGYKYKKPLEKIIIDDEMIKILKDQGLTIDSIPDKNEKIYLRNNSNVSSGGDTYEMSDLMPDFFKEIAINATKAIGVKICGVDIIINDLYQKDYQILELNYNPAIHIHTYPLYGIGKNPAANIIDLLKV